MPRAITHPAQERDPLPPVSDENPATPVYLVGVRLSFNDVFVLVFQIFLANVVIALMVGVVVFGVLAIRGDL
jgi:hypothetical protein